MEGILGLAAISAVIGVWGWFRNRRRLGFIETYVFPQALRWKLQEQHPQLSREEAERVLARLDARLGRGPRKRRRRRRLRRWRLQRCRRVQRRRRVLRLRRLRRLRLTHELEFRSARRDLLLPRLKRV